MPIYTYECQSCGSTLEKRQSFSDAPLTNHEECGGTLRRVIHPAGIVFKGSGFYNTDYKNGSAKRSETADGASEKASSDTAKSENGSTTSASSSDSSKSGGSAKDTSSSSSSTSAAPTSTPAPTTP